MRKYVSQPANFSYTLIDYINVIREMKSISNWKKEEKKDIRSIFEDKFKKYLNREYALSVSSGNVALDLAVECLDLNENDEVIMPAINFYGTHLAVMRKTKKIIFCQVDSKTQIIDYNDIKNKITPKTRAVFITQMNGNCCDIKKIKKICSKSKQKIYIVEDVARSLGSSYKDDKAGSLSDISIFSFQQKKNFSTLGEGGMITTNNKKFYEKIKCIRSFGNKKSWGTNFRMSRVQAAVGISQLDKLDFLNLKRRKVASYRNKLLKSKDLDIEIPDFIDKNMFSIYTYYTIVLKENYTRENRDNLIKIMKDKYNIETCIANEPTYNSHAYIKNKFPFCDVDDDLGGRIINLPIHFNMTKRDNKYIVNSFVKALEETKKINRDILEQINKNYNISPLEIKKIDKGYACEKWIILDRKNKYLLKKMTDTSQDRIDFINYIQNNTKNVKTPKIIKTIDKKNYFLYKNRYYILYEFIAHKNREFDTYKTGKFLGLLHSEFLNLKVPDEFGKQVCITEIDFPKKEVENLLKYYNKNDIEYEILCYKKKNTEKYKYDDTKLKYSIIHGDFYPDNILVSNNEYVIIDYDQCGYFYQSYEFFRGMMKFCYCDNPNKTFAKIKKFTKGYLSIMDMSDDEIRNGIKQYIITQNNDLFCLRKNDNNINNRKEYAEQRYKQLKWLINNEKKVIKEIVRSKKHES